jgi:hypothetical protein
VGRYARAAFARAALRPARCAREPSCAEVDLPTRVAGAPGELDVQLLLWKGRRYTRDAARLAGNITSVRLFEGVTPFASDRLADPIIVRMPVSAVPPGARDSVGAGDAAAIQDLPICQFWDAARGEWSSRGCIARGNSTEELVCECYHLTDFGALLRQTFFAFEGDFGLPVPERWLPGRPLPSQVQPPLSAPVPCPHGLVAPFPLIGSPRFTRASSSS